MSRLAVISLMIAVAVFKAAAQCHGVVVADSLTGSPLPGASVFDSKGNAIGVGNSAGRTPVIPGTAYPITVRYLGYEECTVADCTTDTVFMRESFTELPEVIVESRQHKVLHMLAYVREYSTLSTYTDTVFLFREKMVDFMLTSDAKAKFKGWTTPRVIKTKSYYRFTNNIGLDSVSDVCSHHFSWSDWLGLSHATVIPAMLLSADCVTDTVRGKYSPAEIWIKNHDRISVDVNVLADTVGRRWVPGMQGFFRNDVDFETFRIKLNYDDVTGDILSPLDLSGYSFNIESNGRGHDIFMFNHIDEPCFVSTYGEVYIIDKEYITVKEARKWQRHKFDTDNIAMIEPPGAPDLQPAVMALVERVNSYDREGVRSTIPPDQNIGYRPAHNHNFNFGYRALSMLKQLTGITLIRSHKKFNNNWKDFRDRNRQNKKR
ncbi:MAG: carboxypeptidase-like regulatory domain-containing protein [Odoribacter sp.]|nr:carboxypeptidase-like regulatory domain-containing protein [Odoribacter sp.]